MIVININWLRRIALAFSLLGLTACLETNKDIDGSPVENPTSGSSSSSSSGSTGVESDTVSQSQKAFGQTLYPLLREEQCSICHNSQGAGLEPSHADADLATAHDAALTIVNLESPANSRIVSRLRDDQHHCWGSCETAADEVMAAIADWSRILDGGIIDTSCAPKFPQDLILLSELAFIKSIEALLGDEVLAQQNTPDPATKLFSQKDTVANTSFINNRLDWAASAADNFQRRAAQISGCLEAGRSCAQTFIEKTARRAFKRPIENTEVDDLMMVFDQGATTSFSHGVKLAMQAILLSPSFNHRTEFGQKNADGTYSLTPHEVASVLSFMLTDALPDEELMRAADSGALNDPAERERQTMRLLAMRSTKENLEYTILSSWNMGNLFGKAKDPETFPQFSPTLASQMYEETRLFLHKYLWERSVSQVLTGRTTFVNGALADLYDIEFPGSDPNQFVEVDLVDGKRAGLLTHASFLTAFSRTDTTSVVARGLFVNGPLLCLPEIPEPPEDALEEIAGQLTSDATEAELADYRAATSPCSSCHSQFDAYGLLFENFDAIGGYRDRDAKGNSIHSSVDMSSLALFDGVMNGPVEFAETLAERPEFVKCMTRNIFSYGTGQAIESNHCEVTDITDTLDGDSTLTDIIKGIVTSPALSTRVSE